MAVPCLAPGALLLAGWARVGEPLHAAGLWAVLILGFLAAVIMPALIVSFESLPMLLIPKRTVIWWRQGRERPTIRAFIRRAVLAADRHRCCWCHARDDLQVDHYRPYSRGGLNVIWNFMTLCGTCNRVKSNIWVTRNGYVFYRGFKDSDNKAQALQILAYERWHRWWPGRWIRAGLSLAA
jgi:hypothetical protein